MKTHIDELLEATLYLNRLINNNKEHEIISDFEVGLSFCGDHFTGQIRRLDTGEVIIQFSSDASSHELKAARAYTKTLIDEINRLLWCEDFGE